jgi:hypothetical protein
MSSAGFIVKVTIFAIADAPILGLLRRERAGRRHLLLGLVHGGECSQQARRIDADRIDAEPGEELGNLRIVRRRLARRSRHDDGCAWRR